MALLLAYVVHALRARITPVIDLRLFRIRSFSAASTLLFLLGGSLFGTMFLVPLYYQQSRGANVLHAGLLLAPRALGSALGLLFVGKLIDRTGAERSLTLTGMAMVTVGTIPYALAGPHTSQLLLGAALFVSGAGIGAVLMTAMTATYRELSAEQMAAATSASRIFQQVGGSFGTVVLAIILQHRLAATHEPSGAFHHAFAWALGLAVLALVPALLLARRKNPAPDRV
ncbi:MFS transporter [Actinoallomurus iriomotensis]|uniref:Major facilitator superfamily (MFS) profile domain-containing protein n=1 Tax=Actinoallomurus iriomotensis TaxID=478107 RepID=A0A9W6SCY0_9ACTN|nr:MFS transporter [Actinoallomurus iriomotensis]GLY91306.1 hypothetical protein Airi02_092350 [Actinoallomurus iriomotensis]